MWNYPFFKFININLNIRNERENVENKWGSTSKITPISSLNCSRQLILVSNWGWYKLIYSNGQIYNQLTNIFMNIDENYRKLKKNWKRINKVYLQKKTH